MLHVVLLLLPVVLLLLPVVVLLQPVVVLLLPVVVLLVPVVVLFLPLVVLLLPVVVLVGTPSAGSRRLMSVGIIIAAGSSVHHPEQLYIIYTQCKQTTPTFIYFFLSRFTMLSIKRETG